jgi:hypothetical protein
MRAFANTVLQSALLAQQMEAQPVVACVEYRTATRPLVRETQVFMLRAGEIANTDHMVPRDAHVIDVAQWSVRKLRDMPRAIRGEPRYRSMYRAYLLWADKRAGRERFSGAVDDDVDRWAIGPRSAA